MGQKVKGFYVSLEKDLPYDDAEFVKKCILSLRGVSGVKMNVTTLDDWLNRQQIKYELRDKLLKIICD